MMTEENSPEEDFEQIGEHVEEGLYPTLPSNSSNSEKNMSLHNAEEVPSDDDDYEDYEEAKETLTHHRGSPPQIHVPETLIPLPSNFQLQVEQENVQPQEQATTFDNFQTTPLRIETTPATPIITEGAEVTLHHPQAKRISVELASPLSPENYQSQRVKIKNPGAFSSKKQDYKEHHDREYFEKISATFRPYSGNQFQEITKEEEKEVRGYYALCISGRQGQGKNGDNGVPGSNGAAGTNGKHGADGVNGEPGEDGDNGKNGYNGTNGTVGGDGGNGQDAESVYLVLEGTPEDLKLSGSYDGNVTLPIVEYSDKSGHRGVVWIDAGGSAGGLGGKGGSGGSGGCGGCGGIGGNGADATLPNQSGGAGGKGGDGGNGGNAADGASGGQGGRGGDGASVMLETADSRLLMLVEVDIRGGRGGRGGSGGDGGTEGEEGKGADGGRGGKGSTRAKDGANGAKGKSGSTGAAGNAGRKGADGKPGLPGSIYLIVRDKHGNIKEQGYRRYNVRVTDYTIRGAIDDGVFEPGEEVIIENIQLTNDGDLELPEGSRMGIASNNTFEGLQSQQIIIPSIKSKQSLTLSNVSLRGKIMDVEVPNKGRYHGAAEITPVTQLLSRTFQDSLMTKTIDVRYPLRVERQLSPSVMGLDDVKEFRLEISNVSNATYGSESVGTISYRIILDSSLQLVDTEHSKHIIEGTIKELASKNTATVAFKVRMSKDTPFFERVKWKAELILRGKTIEFSEKEVRAAPHFDTNTVNTDLLFISSSSMSKREYLIYKRVFDGLGLRPNFYDIEMYNGLSPEETGLNPYQEIVRVNWVGKFQGKPIVFPLSTTEDMKLLKGNHIIQHFVSSEREKTDKLDSGMVIVGAVQLKKYMEDLMEECYNSTTYTEEISEENFSDYFVYNSPTRAFMQQRLAKIESDKKKEHPSQLFVAKHTLYEPKRLRLTLYSYGKAVVKQLPLNRLHKLMFVTHGDETASHTPYFLSTGETEEKDLLEPSKNMFKMDSRFFEVLLAIVCSLSVEKKLDLLKGKNAAINTPWKFTKNPKEKIDFFDVIRTALYEDLKREYFFKDQGLSRAERLINYVKKNKQDFMFEAGIYSIWYVISRFTSHTFWRSLPFVSDFNEKRAKLLKLQESLEKELFQNGNPSISASLNEDSLGTTVGSSRVVYAQDVKKKAVEDAEDASRLKLQDLTKRLVFPLYDLNL